MELLITIAYAFLVRLVFFEFHLLKFNLFWKFVVFGLWCLAAMTEIILLGQRAPYSKEMFVQTYVIPMAPDFGGEVTEVLVTANQEVKQGDPLFRMDVDPWQGRVNKLEAELAQAGTDVAELDQQIEMARATTQRTQYELEVAQAEFDMISAAAERNAVSQLRVDQVMQRVLSLQSALAANRAAERQAELAFNSRIGNQHTQVAAVQAELEIARYNLGHRTMYAPSDGYVVNLQLHPGTFVRLKQPVMTFVSTSNEYWLVAKFDQRGSQFIRTGDTADVLLEMYPGKVFTAVVEHIVWATGQAQGVVGGQLPTTVQIRPAMDFVARLRLVDEDLERPLRFGASGQVAVYTSKAVDFLKVLRQIEMQSTSLLNFLFNPF